MIKQKVRHNLVKNKLCVGAICKLQKEERKNEGKKDAPYLDSSIKHICSPRIVVPTAVFNFLCKGVIKIVAGYIIKATLSLEVLIWWPAAGESFLPTFWQEGQSCHDGSPSLQFQVMHSYIR